VRGSALAPASSAEGPRPRPCCGSQPRLLSDSVSHELVMGPPDCSQLIGVVRLGRARPADSPSPGHPDLKARTIALTSRHAAQRAIATATSGSRRLPTSDERSAREGSLAAAVGAMPMAPTEAVPRVRTLARIRLGDARGLIVLSTEGPVRPLCRSMGVVDAMIASASRRPGSRYSPAECGHPNPHPAGESTNGRSMNSLGNDLRAPFTARLTSRRRGRR
jgi:hypothetical protein